MGGSDAVMPVTEIEIGILLLISIVFSILYFRQKKITMGIEHKIDEFFDISTELADQALLIFDEKYKIVFVSDDMDLYVDAKKGDNFSAMKKPSLVKSDKGWIDIYEYIQYILDGDPEETIFVDHATLKIENKEKTISLRISPFGEKDLGRGTFAGISIFNIKSKIKITDMHYINPITGLPNHNKAMADLGLLSNEMTELKKKFAVIIMSIDNFPELASVLGYSQAFLTLGNMARYLDKRAKISKLKIYQMPANDFLFVAKEVDNEEEILKIVVELKKDISNMLLKSSKINTHFTLSSGVSIFHNNNIPSLLNDAYKALDLSIKQGAGYNVVNKEENKISKDSKVDQEEIRRALNSGELQMYYQPIYDLKKDEIIGAEALMRWMHPTKGMIMPSDFIVSAEESELILELDRFALENTINQLSAWKKLGFKEIQISVNISLKELESNNPYKFINEKLIETKVQPSQLKIEITENITTRNIMDSLEEFNKLKKMKLDISIDDFGTAYSSFSMLKQFPIDTIKIDRSYIVDLAKNKNHQIIVKAMMAMIHAMGIKVIAEGVENGKSMEILSEYDCDYIQGYFKGKPMPAFEFQQLIRSEQQEFQAQNANKVDEPDSDADDIVDMDDGGLVLI